MKKILQSLFFLVFLAVTAMAQERTITGTVTAKEDGLPIPGVSVKARGAKGGAVTDVSGKFSIKVSPGTTLEFSYLGYITQSTVIGSSSSVNIALVTDSKTLNEVVVVGYGTQMKTNVTSSRVSIGAEEIKEQPVPNIAQAIQGRMAGVQVSAGSGRPGAPISVNIRGRSSILAGNDPLYVVDGVILPSNSDAIPSTIGTTAVSPISPIANINPDDILTVDVLKDAASAAIYGSRGSNGVVIITTKSGSKKGKTNINVSANTGFQSLTKINELLGASEYRTMYNEARVNAGFTSLFTQSQIDNPTANVNWIDEILNDNSRVNNFQVSVTSGGNEKTQFYTSLNYFDQDGALRFGNFKRYSLRTNISHDITDFLKIGTNTSISRSYRQESPIDNSIYSPFPRALVARPDQPVYNADGTFASNDYNNPVHMFQSVNYVNLSNVFNSTFLEFKILPELKFKSAVGIDYTYADQRTYNPTTSLSGQGANGSASSGYVQTENYLTTQTLSYNKTLFDNRLNVDGTAVYEFQWNNQANNRVDGTNFPSDLTPYITSAAQVTGGTASLTYYKIESMLARLNLAWEGKYLLGASIRRDGSSKIPEYGRFGYFPSVSAGWVISNENFLSNNSVINFLKLRASYGATGNQEGLANFASRRLIGAGFNYNDTPGFALNAIGSPELKWETTNQFDIGLEIGLLKNRIEISADYFNKKTKDLLLNRPIPNTTGFNTILENIGSIKGQGFDFQVSSKNFVGDFKWNTSINLSTYQNEVTLLYNAQPIDGSFVTRTAAGQPLGAFFLVKSLGVDPNTGDMLYEDINGTNTINGDDRQFLGNPLPNFYGGITNTFSYKNFDLNVFFQYSYGNDIYNLAAEGTGGNASLGAVVSASAPATNILREVYQDRWTPANTDSKYPRAVGGPRGTYNTQRSSRYLEDGSYLRLKNLTLGYNFPKTITNKLHLSNLRIYAQGYNILTFTKYSGFDPEVSTNFTVGNTGVDQGSIPQFKTYTFGINIGL